MKRAKSLLIALGIAGAAITAAAQDVALDFTYASAYYWRGADAGGGKNGFVQPSVDVSFQVSELTVGGNIWYSQGPEADDATDNSEIDYTVYGGLEVGDIAVYAGVIDYLIPVDVPFKDGKSVLEAHAGADVGSLLGDDLSLSATAYMNIDGDDDDSMYLAADAGYALDNLGLGLTVALGDGFYSGDGEMTLVNITPNVSYSIPLGDEAEAAVTLGLGINPDAKTKLPFFAISTGWNWSP